MAQNQIRHQGTSLRNATLAEAIPSVERVSFASDPRDSRYTVYTTRVS